MLSKSQALTFAQWWLVIHYCNHAATLASEVLFLDDSGVARQGVAHDSTTPILKI